MPNYKDLLTTVVLSELYIRDREGNIDFLESQVSGLHDVLAHSNFTGDQHVAAG